MNPALVTPATAALINSRASSTVELADMIKHDRPVSSKRQQFQQFIDMGVHALLAACDPGHGPGTHS